MNVVALNSMNKEYVYDSMPNQQDQVIYPTMLLNRLDRIIGSKGRAVGKRPKGSFCSNPSKIWSINMDTSEDIKEDRKKRSIRKETIERTDRILRYKRIIDGIDANGNDRFISMILVLTINGE